MEPLSVTFFGFLEFIGTTELLVVLFVALIVFGPRKLPELGRTLGRALNQVRAASDDFKRTWESDALQDRGARDALTLPVPDGLDEGARSVAAADAQAPGAGRVVAVDPVGSALEARPAEANA